MLELVDFNSFALHYAQRHLFVAGVKKMDIRKAVLIVFLIGVFLVGCSESKTSGYSTYNNPQQQGQYVGGGCGVAPSGAYEDTPLKALDSADSAL